MSGKQGEGELSVRVEVATVLERSGASLDLPRKSSFHVEFAGPASLQTYLDS
jgi:hypothetical protein